MQNQSPNNKIGVGLITCDRKHFFQKSFSSVVGNKDICLVVVDDGKESNVEDIVDKNCFYIKTTGKEGVGKAKNYALKYLMEQNCEHIFLMEDDVEVLDQNVYNLYINASKSTGIKHFNFGLHGNHNRDLLQTPTPRKTVNYPDNTKVVLYPNVLGAFSYYHIDVLNAVGVMDEQFYNALEHVDHTYQIIKSGYHPYFRWFADVEGADKCLVDIVPDHQESKIRSQEDFVNNFLQNHERFVNKNKFAVVRGHGPIENNFTEQEVLLNLKQIWNLHHQK